MLMSIPDEVYEFMDMRGEKPVIISSAPDSVKEKARQIDEKVIKSTGSSFFAEIKQ